MNQETLLISTTRRVAKNTAVLLLGTIVSKLCLLALFMVAARYLGPEEFGKYSFALSFTATFIILGDLGLNTLAIREVARDNSLLGKYLGNILVLKTVLSAGAVGLALLTISLLRYPPDTIRVVYILGISVFFSYLSQSLRWCFQAFQKMEYEALVSVTCSFLVLGAGLTSLYLGGGLVGLARANLLANVVTLAFSFLITVKRFSKPIFSVDWRLWQRMLRRAAPIGLMSILISVYFNANILMLSLTGDSALVGLYNVGYKLVDYLKFVPSMFVLAIFPVMSEFHKSAVGSLRKVLNKAVRYMLIASLPVAIGTTILSPKIVPLIWGEDFSSATPVLQILIWMGGMSFISNILHNYLIAIDKQKVPIFTIGAGVVVNVILNLVLIPKFFFVGASFSILVAQAVIFSSVSFYIFRYLGINPFPKQIFRVLLASLLMGALTWILRELNVFLVVVVSAFIYISLLWVVRGICRDDLALVKQIFRVRNEC
jgi:O-antigen/teichoic acid export membrane protein